ncbi:sulfur carrier protein ThiS [uncultured Hyphomicrobium sp.]|uniref:sulfur carrier protein ThiS n=1 Tax=uncultured Hyphomicrobium sp. TaxID=194373 RepID=UPI0025D5671B|nr:sulfur carrier protein ThiS [uncultured Hyphomicrobium sp.]
MTETATRLCDITLNGAAVATGAATLAALLAEQGFAGIKVATALNGEFVPERLRPATALAAGDRVEILTVRQGG